MINDTIKRIIDNERETIRRIRDSKENEKWKKMHTIYHEERVHYYELLLEQMEVMR